MKTKLVLWGTNAKDEKVLIALELRPKDNKVDIWTFPENLVSEEFSKSMLNEWRNGTAVAFIEGHQHQERALSITESLLPDELKIERGDIIQRAQTEWHFIVLSSKLNEAYQTELAELKEKVEQLKTYDSETWESLKGFWSKVQGQVRERNLFREHANSLRDNTNALFDRLKSLRTALDSEFQSLSKTHLEGFMKTLDEIEARVTKGLNLQSVFDELKSLQRQFRDTKLTREHRSKVWERIDKTFKDVKERRFGPNANNDGSPSVRLKRRFDGLLAAIEKMNRSIVRDKSDLEFQNKKVASSDGQLEAQIRQAKIKMIEERISSKEEKLSEMMKTRQELEKRMKDLVKKEAEEAEKEKVRAAQRAAKEKIKEQMKQAEAEREGNSEKLEKAAEAIVTPEAPKVTPPKTETPKTEVPKDTPPEESIMDALSNTVGETLEDVVDTAKAVAIVMGDKISDAIKDFSKDDDEDKAAEASNEEE
ncbi:MAG: hypothetical protein AB8G15_00500 [Saprospiraceae bacterium]